MFFYHGGLVDRVTSMKHVSNDHEPVVIRRYKQDANIQLPHSDNVGNLHSESRTDTQDNWKIKVFKNGAAIAVWLVQLRG